MQAHPCLHLFPSVMSFISTSSFGSQASPRKGQLADAVGPPGTPCNCMADFALPPACEVEGTALAWGGDWCALRCAIPRKGQLLPTWSIVSSEASPKIDVTSQQPYETETSPLPSLLLTRQALFYLSTIQAKQKGLQDDNVNR